MPDCSACALFTSHKGPLSPGVHHLLIVFMLWGGICADLSFITFPHLVHFWSAEWVLVTCADTLTPVQHYFQMNVPRKVQLSDRACSPSLLTIILSSSMFNVTSRNTAFLSIYESSQSFRVFYGLLHIDRTCLGKTGLTCVTLLVAL